jgi:2-dehydro-3-deoxyphosphogluconate aldolase/(4S)-4-hydroxy-2-oxoglutarate aldolase
MDINKKIEALGIVPVVVLNDADDAVPLCKALAEGGLPVAEITFRTAAAEESIRRVAKELPDVLVGAGTVLTIDQVDRAIGAGAKFIVSPGFNPEVVGYCVKNGYPIFPGCPTTSDIEAAMSFGLKVVKFFPAEAMGGLKVIKAVAAPYGQMKFMPTGGVNEKNLLDYLAFDKIIACGGSWMVDKEAVATKNFAKITELTRSAVKTMLGFELKHIGVNCADPEEALKVAKKFSALFGWAVKEGNSSTFAGTAVECMKAPYLGKNGHIAVGTTSVVRAKAYLESQGFEFDESTAKYKGEKLNAIYLKDEIGGFAIHLVNK